MLWFARMVTLSVLVTIVGGCGTNLAWFFVRPPPPPEPYRFYWGNPGKITNWTLEQKDPEQVIDGLASLEHVILVRNSEKQRKAAAAGYVRIYRRVLEGWPGEELYPAPPDHVLKPAWEIVLRYASISVWGMQRQNPDDPLITSLLHEVVALQGIFDAKPRSATAPSGSSP